MKKKKEKASLAEQVANGSLKLEPTQKLVEDAAGERIVEKTLPELVAEGLVSLGASQKIVGEGSEAKIVERSPAELLTGDLVAPSELVAEGRLKREDVQEHIVERLRGEVSAHFHQHRTPGGYRLDDLARQKASFSAPFRRLPAEDEQKKELLEAGLIYPDEVLDEILAEVAKIQTAYRAAKKAVTTAFDKGQPVEKWEAVSLQDHLPGAKKKKARKKKAPKKKAGPSKKKPAGKKKSSGKKTASKKKTKKGGSS